MGTEGSNPSLSARNASPTVPQFAKNIPETRQLLALFVLDGSAPFRAIPHVVAGWLMGRDSGDGHYFVTVTTTSASFVPDGP
jgi:hypothetical protein